MIPLSLSVSGKLLKIHKVNGNKEVKIFLESLGFINGSYISVISKINGNIIVNIKNSRIAINKELASKIMMEEVV